MGLTPEQIATINSQDMAVANQINNIAQQPVEAAIRQAQLNAALRKEPTIPVETPYGMIPMTPEMAMQVFNQKEGRDIQRQTAADTMANRALLAQIAGQNAQSTALNAQTNLDRLAETRAENIAKGKREDVEQQERVRKNILHNLETYAKNPKGSPDLLASSINDASTEIFPEVMFTNKNGDSYTLDPSSMIDEYGKPVTKQYIDKVAKETGVSRTTIVKELVKKNADPEVNPGFTESWSSISKPIKESTYLFNKNKLK